MIVSVSGTSSLEVEAGRRTAICSGGLNCVVDMKKIRSRNATSTMGVMSMRTGMRLAMTYDSSLSSSQRLLEYLHNKNRLICLDNGRFISIEAMEQIKERVKRVIEKNGKLAIGDCKDVLGYGRTVGFSVFDYLDSIGFTRRQGDERVLMTDEETGS